MTKALDHFDPARKPTRIWFQHFRRPVNIWFYRSARTGAFLPRSQEIVDALVRAKKNVASAVIESEHGRPLFAHSTLYRRPKNVLKPVTGKSTRWFQMTLRGDLALITKLINANARVLDLGCGTGDLLANLQAEKNVNGYGLDKIQQTFRCA